MTMADQIANIAMTPDGTHIAGATADKVLVWKLEDPTVPYASWNKESHPGWRSPKTGAEVEEILAPCLGWDAEGGKLVYGLNSRVRTIFIWVCGLVTNCVAACCHQLSLVAIQRWP